MLGIEEMTNTVIKWFQILDKFSQMTLIPSLPYSHAPKGLGDKEVGTSKTREARETCLLST